MQSLEFPMTELMRLVLLIPLEQPKLPDWLQASLSAKA
jgi:hypothetical protein